MRENQPFFSIIVPTYNRPEKLADCLESLSRLDYPRDRFEVIVVDDGGSVPLEPTISRFDNLLNLTLLKQNNTGPALARNCGASQSRGQYLAFTDDDCLPDRDWLHKLSDVFRRSATCLYGGRTINAHVENIYSTATQMRIDYLYEQYNPTNKFDGFFLANNFAVAKERFKEVGGFDPTLRFGEDRDFCYRWRKRGYSFIFAPHAVVYHAHSLSLSSFLQLHFLYGGGNFQFLQRCTIRGMRSIRLSPLSWYVELILSGIRKERGLQGLLLTFLIIAAQATYTAGLFWEALKKRSL